MSGVGAGGCGGGGGGISAISRAYHSTNSYAHQNNREKEDVHESTEEVIRGRIIERIDELSHRHFCEKFVFDTHQPDIGDKIYENLEQMHIVGIPHAFRKPVELRDKIHFWELTDVFDHTRNLDINDIKESHKRHVHDTEDQKGIGRIHPITIRGSKLPTFTLKVPDKSFGINTLLFENLSHASFNGRFLLSTQKGDCLELIPTLKSDWAGVMYPPGYQVISDNIVYIEDEDEFDIIVQESCDGSLNDIMENDVFNSYHKNIEENSVEDNMNVELHAALQLSDIEGSASQEPVLDVVGNDNFISDLQSELCIIPCRPGTISTQKYHQLCI